MSQYVGDLFGSLVCVWVQTGLQTSDKLGMHCIELYTLCLACGFISDAWTHQGVICVCRPLLMVDTVLMGARVVNQVSC